MFCTFLIVVVIHLSIMYIIKLMVLIEAKKVRIVATVEDDHVRRPKTTKNSEYKEYRRRVNVTAVSGEKKKKPKTDNINTARRRKATGTSVASSERWSGI